MLRRQDNVSWHNWANRHGRDNFCCTGSIQLCSWHSLFHGIVSCCFRLPGQPGCSPEERSSSCRPLLQELLPEVDLSGGAPVTTSRGGCPGADAKVFDACGKKFCGRYISPWTSETGCGYFSPRKVRLRGTGRRSGSGRINSSAIRRCDLTPRQGCGERRFRRDRGR